MRGLESAHDRALRACGELLGAPVAALPTPALLVDLDRLEANVGSMAEHFRGLPTELRPHVKVHKCPEIARRQVAAGAIGVATATAWEALVMARAGIDDVLVANQVVGPAKIDAVLSAPPEMRMTVAVDDLGNVGALSRAAVAAGRVLGVLIELDIGQGRCGVRTADEALALADAVAVTPGLELRGMQGYEGHCMLEPDHDVRAREAEAAIGRLVEAVDRLAAAGHASPVVSGGGTGTYFITGANARMTEIQAGSYALMDAFHGDLVPGGFAVAMTVLATVISRQGRTVVADAGRKAVGVDFTLPRPAALDGATVRFVAEEHTLIDFAGTPPVDVGDRIELVAGYGPTTANLHGAFMVHRDGIVEDVWPIAARGGGPLELAPRDEGVVA